MCFLFFYLAFKIKNRCISESVYPLFLFETVMSDVILMHVTQVAKSENKKNLLEFGPVIFAEMKSTIDLLHLKRNHS